MAAGIAMTFAAAGVAMPTSSAFAARAAVSSVSTASAIAPVTNLRVVSASTVHISVAWTASSTPNVVYDLYLNGRLANSSSTTQGSVSGVYLYPGPGFATGTAPKKGRNVVGVQARSVDPASFGATSAIVEVTVRL